VWEYPWKYPIKLRVIWLINAFHQEKLAIMDHAPQAPRTSRQKWTYGLLCGGLSLLVLGLAALLVFLGSAVASGGFEKYGPKPAIVVSKTAFPAETRVDVKDGYAEETTTEAAWVLTVEQEAEGASFSVEVDEATYAATEAGGTVCVHRGDLLPLAECRLS
jgi:hypothetical protein